jgi:hypothetical protein
MFSHLGSTFTGVGGESEAGEDLGGSGKGLGKDLGVAGFAEQHHVCDERPALNGLGKILFGKERDHPGTSKTVTCRNPI